MDDVYNFLLLGWVNKSVASALLVAGEVGLLVASIIVIVGLIGESRADKLSESWIPTPSNIKHWHTIFAISVTIGVIGELLSDGDIFAASHRLQAIQDIELSRLDADTATANKRASELEIKSAELNKEAEELRAKNLVLEAQVAPRRMDQQCKDFPSSIKSFSGEVVRVETYLLDIDGGILGAQIVGCLNSLGIKADAELSSILPTGWFGVGVFVSGRNEPLISEIKGALVRVCPRTSHLNA
jgi:hypothetical protein